MSPGTRHDSKKGGISGSHHNYLLRYANHSWKLSAEWWIFPSAPIRALVSDTRKLSIVLSLMIFSSLSLRLHCHKLVFFQPVACLINSAPSPTKFNTACPPPDTSALSFIKSIIASLQLLATDSHCECELEHSMDMISPFPESYFSRCWDKSMASVGLGKTTCQKWMARLHVRGVRACMHYHPASQQRLIPSRSHRDDGSLWAVEFSDHVQILPWASSSQYSQK